jgi:hypothetical protein
MDNIVEPNHLFDFSKITLAHPVSIQGGGYFTKIENNNKSLYVQTSKSVTRQGFVKSGKKYYCDLMFDSNSETIIHWFENLEEKCHKLIYEKKNEWFEGNLEESDIENAFNPLIRIYKSGKYYLLRVNIKNTKEDLPAIKIYNEKEVVLSMSDITPEVEIMCILDIKGIKFTPRNFQIEIELKQVMALDNEKVFDSCLIKTSKTNMAQNGMAQNGMAQNGMSLEPNHLLKNNLEELDNLEKQEEVNNLEKIIERNIEEDKEKHSGFTVDEAEDVNTIENKDNINVDIEFEEITEEPENDLLKEINEDSLHLENTDTSMTLKKPNEIYIELYKEARNKAKLAKKNAIIAYLNAKNIKKTYMIDNINDSDSEFDAEIDEVSESELDEL